MKRGRGRPLKLRSDTELLDYLEKVLGFGRERMHAGFFWTGPTLSVRVGQPSNPAGPDVDDEYSAIGAGVDLRRALSHAISTHPRGK